MNKFEKMYEQSNPKEAHPSNDQPQDPAKRETLRKLLKFGVATVTAGTPVVRLAGEAMRLWNTEAHAAETELGHIPIAFQEMVKKHNAERVLKNPEYANAKTYEQVNALYENYNAEDPAQSVAMAVKMIELIDISDEQVPREKMERIYQQGGFSTQNALRHYFNSIKKDAIDPKTSQNLLEAFQKVNSYYTMSAKYDGNPLKGQEDNQKRTFDKTYAGMIDLNTFMTDVSNKLLINGTTRQDMQVAAQLRASVRDNVTLFERLNYICNFGNGRILYPGKEQSFKMMSGFVRHIIPENADEFLEKCRSLQVWPGEIVVYLNGVGKNDHQLAIL